MRNRMRCIHHCFSEMDFVVWPSSKFLYLTKEDRCPYVVDEYRMGVACGVVELTCAEDTSVFPNACSGRLPEAFGGLGLAVYAYRRPVKMPVQGYPEGQSQAVLHTRLVGQPVVAGAHLMCSGTLRPQGNQTCLHVRDAEQADRVPILPVPKPRSVAGYQFPQLGPAVTTMTTSRTTQTTTSVTITATTVTTWTGTTVTTSRTRTETSYVSTTATSTATYTYTEIPVASSSFGLLPWILAASAAVIMAVLYLLPAREERPESRDVELTGRLGSSEKAAVEHLFL